MSPPRVFPIARATSSGWRWFFVLAAAIAVLPLAVVLAMSLWPSDVRFVVGGTHEGLSVKGSVYGRTLPFATLRTTGARRLTVADTPGTYPSKRTNGIGLPSYQAGWFTLVNGKKALLFVTDWGRTVEVPTKEDYTLLVSPSDPEAFLSSLATPGGAARVFPLATPPKRGLGASQVVTWLALVVIPAGVVGLLALLAFAGLRVRFELDDDVLRIRGDLYGRKIPRAELLAAEAKQIDLRKHGTFGRMLRVNGVGLPNYASGWFRPRGGGRALLFVTDRTRVIAVPTTLGYTLIVSPADPDAFLEALTTA